MKKLLKILIATISVLGIAYVFICTSFPFSPDKTKCMNDGDRLTTTHWKQMGGFQKFTPDSLRTGCWSTALAQIVYFHKLKPFGHIEYTSRQGYKINETMDSSQFNFATFTEMIDSTT
ncbi:MAG: C10 family peptidase, partial [Chitinophagaceae bacterium]|nr:C10 family peptidase [Chitinophagaceae bacterium]